MNLDLHVPVDLILETWIRVVRVIWLYIYIYIYTYHFGNLDSDQLKCPVWSTSSNCIRIWFTAALFIPKGYINNNDINNDTNSNYTLIYIYSHNALMQTHLHVPVDLPGQDHGPLDVPRENLALLRRPPHLANRPDACLATHSEFESAESWRRSADMRGMKKGGMTSQCIFRLRRLLVPRYISPLVHSSLVVLSTCLSTCPAAAEAAAAYTMYICIYA